MGQMSELTTLTEDTVERILAEQETDCWFFKNTKTDRLWLTYLIREMEAMMEGCEYSEVHIKDPGLLVNLKRDSVLKYKAWDTAIGDLRQMLSGRIPFDPGFVKLVRQFFMLEA